MPPATAKAVSDLCVRCGFCCSGELFDHAYLQPGEAAAWQSQDFALTTVPGKQDGTTRDAFLMPCQHLAGTACSRYQLGRPAVCSSFFCKLALALAEAEVTEADAHELVRQTQDKLAALRPYMAVGETWPQMRARWRSLEAKPSGDPHDARFRVMMAALQIWLNRHFRKNRSGTSPRF